MLTGMAYAPRNVHLVIATRVGDYADVARLIHCRSLMRDDPDHAEHRDKHVSMVLLCDQVPPAIEDFARRHHVRIVARAAVPEPDASIAAAPGSADSRPDWD